MMFGNIEKTELLNIVHRPSVLRGQFTERASHVLLFRFCGESRYRFGENTMLHREGEILFIPKGSSYSVRKACDGDASYIAVNFMAQAAPEKPVKADISGLTDYHHLCTRLAGVVSPDTAAERYRQKALFYEALSLFCEASHPEYMTSGAYAIIEPAVEYLKTNLFDPVLKVGQLHVLCGISDTYFRKLFFQRFGAAPKKYVLNKRLGHAKAILDDGEYIGIAQVAAQSGFDDPLYFSKAFRQRYGRPPSRWK